MKAHELWEEYEQECKKFDSVTCTGPAVRGEQLPATIQEQMAVNRHAQDQRRRVREEAARVGIPEDVLEQVRRRYK